MPSAARLVYYYAFYNANNGFHFSTKIHFLSFDTLTSVFKDSSVVGMRCRVKVVARIGTFNEH